MGRGVLAVESFGVGGMAGGEEGGHISSPIERLFPVIDNRGHGVAD